MVQAQLLDKAKSKLVYSNQAIGQMDLELSDRRAGYTFPDSI